MTRVPPASTTRPLPSLPLPIDAKRIGCGSAGRGDASREGLLELVLKQRQDPLAVLRLVGCAVRILDADDAGGRRFGDLDPVLLWLVLVVRLPEHQLGQKAG